MFHSPALPPFPRLLCSVRDHCDQFSRFFDTRARALHPSGANLCDVRWDGLSTEEFTCVPSSTRPRMTTTSATFQDDDEDGDGWGERERDAAQQAQDAADKMLGAVGSSSTADGNNNRYDAGCRITIHRAWKGTLRVGDLDKEDTRGQEGHNFRGGNLQDRKMLLSGVVTRDFPPSLTSAAFLPLGRRWNEKRCVRSCSARGCGRGGGGGSLCCCCCSSSSRTQLCCLTAVLPLHNIHHNLKLHTL